MLPYLCAILILLLLLVVTIFVLLYISGLFQRVLVYRKAAPMCIGRGGSRFVYKLHEGPYEEAGYLFTETASIAPDRIQCGIHIRSADELPVSNTAAVGALFEADSEESDLERFEKAGFQVARLPSVEEVLMASFPHTSFLSIRIGSSRAYRQLESYIEEHDLKVSVFLELYDGEWIHYLGLLSNDHEFRALITPTEKSNEPEPAVETLVSANLPPGDGEPSSMRDSTAEMDELEATFEKIPSVQGPVPTQL